MKKFILSALFLFASIGSHAMEIHINNIKQIGHSDGYSQDGSFASQNIFSANILIDKTGLSFPIVYIVDGNRKLNDVMIFSTTEVAKQNEESIKKTMLTLKEYRLFYADVKKAVSEKLIKDFSLTN